MNLSQFKQLVQNNLWHGEQQRQRLSRELVVVPSFVSVDMSRVWGCDISHWQGLVNLLVAKNNGCSFVIIKACDGSLNTNYFIENRNKAKEVGLLWGAYVWLYPNSRVSIAAQVAAWWARLKDDYPPLGVWIDTEWTTYAGQTANPSAADLKSALDQFRALSGQAGVYTAAGYANQYLIGFDWSSADLWVANYNVVNPQLPSGATKYKFHQFTSNLDGVNLIGTTPDSKEADGDYYNGTREKFAAEFEPPTGGTMLWYRATGNITMRVAASSTSANAQIGEVNQYVLTGDLVETSVQSNGFVLISRVYRNGGFVELPPVAWCGMAYLAEAEAPILTPSVYITHVFSDALILDGTQYKADFTVENVEYKPQS